MQQGSPIYLELLSRIRGGAVGQGERLVDTTLAAELGVSRMPVREALLRLVHEGYLVGTTRGFRLPELSRQDVADIFEVRRLLEPRAAATAAAGLTPAALAMLEAAFEAAHAALAEDEQEAFMEANSRFRQAWLDATPNRRLASAIARFVDHVQLIRHGTLQNPASRQAAMSLLEELMLGFRRRDALAVQDVMMRFVDRAQELYFALTDFDEPSSRR